MASDATKATAPLALVAEEVPGRQESTYPPDFAARVAGRLRRRLGDAFGLRNFGVNLTTLEPGAQSALLHRHSKQDEFVFVLSGRLTLVTDRGRSELSPGMCAGFPAGGVAHHLVNESEGPASYLEVGDRRPGDAGEYPEDDLVATATPDGWRYSRKDGTPW